MLSSCSYGYFNLHMETFVSNVAFMGLRSKRRSRSDTWSRVMSVWTTRGCPSEMTQIPQTRATNLSWQKRWKVPTTFTAEATWRDLMNRIRYGISIASQGYVAPQGCVSWSDVACNVAGRSSLFVDVAKVLMFRTSLWRWRSEVMVERVLRFQPDRASSPTHDPPKS